LLEPRLTSDLIISSAQPGWAAARTATEFKDPGYWVLYGGIFLGGHTWSDQK
jgi:hypothetical protein